MDYESRLSISFYREIAVINQEHHIFLVQHIENHKFYVKKVLKLYHIDIYRHLKEHPVKGIPKIIELHEEDGQLTIIEEYISGETIEDYLLTHGSLPIKTAADYIVQLCEILTQLHHLSPAVIHRDIKPSNIMITPFGNVVLLDLNAAKYVDTSKNSDTILLGTQGYAAPEQYGFGSSNVQTDIYGVGVLLNILLTGELPGKCIASGPLSPIIRKCIQMRPQDRYHSIDALKKAILELGLDTSSLEPSTKQSFHSFLPPGFRRGNPLFGVLAVFGYALIIYMGCTLTVEDVSPQVLLFERIIYILILLIIVFFSSNYQNIHRLLPFCSSKYLPIRIGAVIFYDFLILVSMVGLMLFIETIIFATP